jgi:hypothetical protein
MSDYQAEPARDYACAVGSAVLAMSGLESNIFYLLQILDASHSALDVEKGPIRVKIKLLEKESDKQHVDSKVRARLEKIVSEANRLKDERNNIAHDFLWTDPFTGEHKRRRVFPNGKVSEGARFSPGQIERITFDLILLAADMSDLAGELGGWERWEEYVKSLNI